RHDPCALTQGDLLLLVGDVSEVPPVSCQRTTVVSPHQADVVHLMHVVLTCQGGDHRGGYPRHRRHVNVKHPTGGGEVLVDDAQNPAVLLLVVLAVQHGLGIDLHAQPVGHRSLCPDLDLTLVHLHGVEADPATGEGCLHRHVDQVGGLAVALPCS